MQLVSAVAFTKAGSRARCKRSTTGKVSKTCCLQASAGPAVKQSSDDVRPTFHTEPAAQRAVSWFLIVGVRRCGAGDVFQLFGWTCFVASKF